VGDEVIDFHAIDIEDANATAVFCDEVPAHRLAHEAEPNETDFHGWCSL
jgi:hypothetical protein